jgi:predicted esterase
LIFLHGLGDTGTSFKEIFKNEKLCKLPAGTKVILPTAPIKRMRINELDE